MSQDKSKLSKADKLLGKKDTNTNELQNLGNLQSKGSLSATPMTEKTFKDELTILSDKKYIIPSLAQFGATQLLSGRAKIDPQHYERNLLTYNFTEIPYQPLSIQTIDGAKVSALEIGDPKSKRCLIVFQPKDGNFQEAGALQALFEMAEETGVRVIAFNYRDKPPSLDAFDYDGTAVAQYAISEGYAPSNISFYGTSLGGAVAAETAAKLKYDENKEVKTIIASAPKSLAHAGKLLDFKQLIEDNPELKKQLSKFKAIQSAFPLAFMKTIVKIIFGRDFDADASLNQLDKKNVECIRVIGDSMVTEKATAAHSQKDTIICRTHDKDKHNAPPKKLIVLPRTPQATEPQASDRKITFMELLRDIVNPDKKLQKENDADLRSSASRAQSRER